MSITLCNLLHDWSWTAIGLANMDEAIFGAPNAIGQTRTTWISSDRRRFVDGGEGGDIGTSVETSCRWKYQQLEWTDGVKANLWIWIFTPCKKTYSPLNVGEGVEMAEISAGIEYMYQFNFHVYHYSAPFQTSRTAEPCFASIYHLTRYCRIKSQLKVIKGTNQCHRFWELHL